MAKLLLDERPFVFQPTLAVILGGSDEAIVIQNLQYWLNHSKNYYDGRYWVYNSMKDWAKQFPWVSESTVKRIFKKLEDDGYIISGNYNKAGFDRTKWYTIDYTKLEQSKDPKRDNQLHQNDPMGGVTLTQPIPKDYQETTTIDYTRDILSSSIEPDRIPYSEIVDHLNQKANTKYRSTTSKTKTLIKARWNEGNRLEDFKRVIDNKCSEWLGKDMAKYLRPETLFGTKFEGYLNESSQPKNKAQSYAERYWGDL